MDIKILIRKYMTGECSAEEAKVARKWLDEHIADPAFDEVFTELLNDTAPSEADGSMSMCWSRVEKFIENDIELHRTVRAQRSFFRWAHLAVIAAACAVAFLFFKAEEPVVWNEMYAERGTTAHLQLPDGTSLWLNSGTKVIYPSRFSSQTRSIFVDGEVYADVSKDPEKPFIVSTSDIKVTVHGTKLCIKSFADESNVEVALMSGSVTVEDTDHEVFTKTLKPGELIRYNNQTEAIEHYNINPKTYGNWTTTNDLRFINESLEDIVQELERHFDAKIIIEDPTLAKTQYYASFINDEGLDKILQALNSNNTMTISKRNDIIVISHNK